MLLAAVLASRFPLRDALPLSTQDLSLPQDHLPCALPEQQQPCFVQKAVEDDGKLPAHSSSRSLGVQMLKASSTHTQPWPTWALILAFSCSETARLEKQGGRPAPESLPLGRAHEARMGMWSRDAAGLQDGSASCFCQLRRLGSSGITHCCRLHLSRPQTHRLTGGVGLRAQPQTSCLTAHHTGSPHEHPPSGTVLQREWLGGVFRTPWTKQPIVFLSLFWLLRSSKLDVESNSGNDTSPHYALNPTYNCPLSLLYFPKSSRPHFSNFKSYSSLWMLYAVSNPFWEPQWTRHTRDTSGTLTSFYI